MALAAVLLLAGSAQADFSYTTTRKQSGGVSVAGRNSMTKFYIKGAKMKVDSGNRAFILDFDARTLTTVDNGQKTISIETLKESGAEAPKIEVNESILTTDLDSPELRQMGASMRMEMHLRLAGDVPGGAELHEFYRKHLALFPWTILSGDGNRAIEEALTGLQSRIAGMTGVPVLEVVMVKPAHGVGMTQGRLQPTPAQATKMRDQMAELDATIQKGGPNAASAARSLALMNAVLAPQHGLDASGAFFEITLESVDFSDALIPESVFATPSGYRAVESSRDED